MPAPYSTPADVQAMVPALPFGVGQNPTTAQVTTYLQLTQADIDVVLLRAGINAPVDFTVTPAPVTQELLRRLNAQGGAAMTAAAAPTFPADRRKQLQDEYHQALAGLSMLIPRLDYPIDPGDTEPRGSGVTVSKVTYPDSAPYASIDDGARVAGDLPANIPYFFRDQRF